MANNVTYINLNGNTAKDSELVRLINLVAAADHRSPHNLTKHILLEHLTVRAKELGIEPAQQAFKAAV